jgi:hypothetical protein
LRLTAAARAKAVSGLDEVTRAALERAEEKVLEDAGRRATTSSRSQAAADRPRGHSRLARSPAPTDHPGIFAAPGGESGYQAARETP